MTGYGTGGPLGSSVTRPRTSGNSSASSLGKATRRRSRTGTESVSTMNCETLVCGNTWSSGR